MSKLTPFKGKTPNDILESNKKCDIKFKKSAWENVSKCGIFLFIELENFIVNLFVLYFEKARKLTMLMLMKKPEERIKLSQILQNEFVMSSLTLISDKTNSMTSNKVKSLESNPEHFTNNSSKSNNPKHRTTISNNQIVLEQNMLQLPSNFNFNAVSGSGSSNSSNNILNVSEQNCLKSVNSLFMMNSKSNFESSSILSENFSPSHFTGTEKKSLNTNSFSVSNTLSGKAMGFLNKTFTTNKTGKSDDEFSQFFRKSEIFQDENPVIDWMLIIRKVWRKPHPSKNF